MPRWVQSLEERFWSKVDKSGGPEACWPWKAGTNDGYGQFYLRGRPIKAPRVAWEMAHGAPPINDACHTCDNRPCCNPRHLFDGTQTDNMNDMWAKGRGAHGEQHYRAKLTIAQVVAIREAYALGDRLFQLAAQYNLDRMTIKAIVSRKTWKAVP